MGFPRQEYWSGLPFSSPGDLPDPGIELASPTLADDFFFLPLSHQGSPYILQIGPPLFSNRQQARKQSLCSFLELQRIRIPLPSQISQSERKQALNLVSVIAVYRVTEGFVYLCSYISRLYEHDKAPLSISKFESYLLFATLHTVARQAPLSVGILQARELE